MGMIPMGSAWVNADTPLPNRRPNDAYLTPFAAIETCLDVLDRRFSKFFKQQWQGYIFRGLDVGAGEDGRWGEALRKRHPGIHLTGVEIRDAARPPYFDVWYPNTDFLLWKPDTSIRYSFIFGNPPYSEDDQIVEKSLELLTDGGLLAFLLPLRFLCGQKRRDYLFKRHPLTHQAVFSQRISWTGKGTNTLETAFFCWVKGHTGPWTGELLKNYR